MSYLDQLDFGLQACPDVLPDLWSLADALPTALDELVAATGVDRAQAEKLSRSA
jgi:diacylglycerol O-acyltransferase